MPFSYNTAGSNTWLGLTLGNITLQADGVFTRNETDVWGFDGVIRAHTPDYYNFNASSHRTPVAEYMTTIGRYLGEVFEGKPFYIEINGEVPIKF